LAVSAFIALAITAALALPGTVAQAAPPTVEGCTLLAGGPPVPTLDPQDAEGWNRLNFSFFDAALTAMAPQGRLEQAFFAADAADPEKVAEALRAQAERAGCTRLMAVSVFNDISAADDVELVFSLRVSSIRPQARSAGAAGGARLGPVDYQREYRYKATPETLARVVPSRIGEQAVQDYLHSKRP
jgi:hypothetical protein